MILLIGNGPSVLNHKLGTIIDGYEDVVRFNNYQIKGYEEYVGTRTTMLSRRACDDVILHPSVHFTNVFCFVTYCRWTSGMVSVSRIIKQHYGDKCEVIDWKKCKQIGEQIGLDQPYNEWASVGVLTIALLVERFGRENVVLHGFDGLNSNGNNEIKHYFDVPPKDGKFHSGVKECRFIDGLGLDRLV
jgi:hypothetical protein